MRFEILYEFGGFMADADSICRHPVDELLVDKGACTVYDQADTEKAGVSPFLAAEPGNPVLGEVISRLAQLKPWDLLKPWRSTGNRFLIRAIPLPMLGRCYECGQLNQLLPWLPKMC